MQTTPQILADWEKLHGRCWIQEIRRIAESGLTWSDTGYRMGVNASRLSSFCHSRGLTFPWQGHRSPVCRDHQRRMAQDNPPPGRKPDLRWYNGKPASLRDHAVDHGHTETTIRCRLNRGWTLQKALTTPKMDASTVGSMGGRITAARRHVEKERNTETNCPAHESHGLQQRGNRT